MTGRRFAETITRENVTETAPSGLAFCHECGKHCNGIGLLGPQEECLARCCRSKCQEHHPDPNSPSYRSCISQIALQTTRPIAPLDGAKAGLEFCARCGDTCKGIELLGAQQECLARCCRSKCRERFPDPKSDGYQKCIAQIALRATRAALPLTGARAAPAPRSERWSVLLVVLLIAVMVGVTTYFVAA